jgi:hypothetical protein
MNRTVLRGCYLFAIACISTNGNARELIKNGSFEADGFSTSRLYTEWNDGLGRGFNVLQYPFGDCGTEWCGGTAGFEVPGTPSSGVSGPVGRGELYAYAFSTGREVGGVVEFQGFAAQHVDLLSHAGEFFNFSAWLASRIPDTDFAIVRLEFFSGPNGVGDSLGSVSFDGNDQQSEFIIGSANALGLADPSVSATQDNWTLYRATGAIPLLASSAVVTIHGETVVPQGFVNNAYVDLVSLQVVPEPTSLILAAVGLVTAIVSLSPRRLRWFSTAR